VIATAARVAVLPLRRRVIGSLVVVAGVLVVLSGFFARIGTLDTAQATSTPSGRIVAVEYTAADVGGALSPSQILRHAVDQGITGDTTIQKLADAGLRGAVALMAAAALLALLLLRSPARGLLGVVAGLGIVGAALTIGIVSGTNTRVSDFTNGNVHLTLGGAGVICALGFAAIIAGGAVAAARPLAGLFSGISLALMGVVAGVLVAIVVGGDRIVSHFSAPPSG
jgi:hypothetical protein